MKKIETEGYFFHDHPQNCDPEDFWGQVMRTVDGNPVDEEQISLIINGICDGLALVENDYVYDMCCGNGALSRYVFERCMGGVGVDFSEFLIDVAKKNFAIEGREVYKLDDVLDFALNGEGLSDITKMFCFGSFQYLPRDRIQELFDNLAANFNSLDRCFIGNLPNRNDAEKFFASKGREVEALDDSTTAIGYWWDQAEISELASNSGWEVQFSRLPERFYASNYRFNAILLRK